MNSNMLNGTDMKTILQTRLLTITIAAILIAATATSSSILIIIAVLAVLAATSSIDAVAADVVDAVVAHVIDAVAINANAKPSFKAIAAAISSGADAIVKPLKLSRPIWLLLAVQATIASVILVV